MRRPPDWTKIRNPKTLAKALWSSAAVDLSPAEFWGYFVRLTQHSDDPYCLWYAGGGLRDYLRQHPGALPIPLDLVFTLLSAENPDARCVGGKLLVLCDDVPTDVMVKHLCAAIREQDEVVGLGGVHESIAFIEQIRLKKRTLTLPEVNELKDALAAAAEWFGENDFGRMASRRLDDLDDALESNPPTRSGDRSTTPE